MKRLFWDIETSPNVVLAWRAGYKLSISPESIISERKIITIAWKWEGEKRVNALHWDAKQDDKSMLKEFIPVLDSADESVAHFGDSFDLPWIKGRCLFHRIPTLPKYVTIDTKQWSSRYFYLNSNKLDYLAKFLGFEGKIKTDYDLWKKIVLDKSESALRSMIKYNREDVVQLEKVYNRLAEAVPHRTHAGVLAGGEKWSCAKCASTNVTKSKTWITAKGTPFHQMHCGKCYGYYSISESVYKKYQNR